MADTDVGTDGVSVTDISEADEPSPANEHTPARGDDTNQDAGAALVLKVGGKAEHPTLGNVTILVLGALESDGTVRLLEVPAGTPPGSAVA